ncbi:MAG TPA: hypothetical protein VE422_16850 [Terriglobia bacterium]|nr:hypothetical protein [Terriglobia bacterium]
MLRILRRATLFLLLLTVPAPTAHADWWEILAELTGPGPSDGRGKLPESATATIYCRGFNSGSGFFRLLDRGDPRGPCFFVDLHNFEAPDDDKFFRVRTTLTEVGPTYRLAPPIEVGVGLGVIHFNSSGRTADRLTISFPRVVFKPLLLVPSLQEKRKGNWGFFQIYFRATHIIGELNSRDDFRPKPGHTFQTRDDLVPSTGFLIDVVGLTRLILNK